MKLIEVDYEVLPHVIDVDDAMKPDAPLLFEDMITRGIEPAPTKPSNISKRIEYKMGDIAAGFAAADEVVEMSFKTAPVHQGYIEPHACLARTDADGQVGGLGVDPGPLRRAHHGVQAARHEDRATCACMRPRSAAPSAARPSSTSSRWPSSWRASRAIP